MERVPVFMYDRVNGASELVFMSPSVLANTHMTINDLKTGTASIKIPVVPVLEGRPHRMIIHEDGDNFQMLAVDDRMIANMKGYMFTKELINKHLDGHVRRRRSKRRSVKKNITSRLASRTV